MRSDMSKVLVTRSRFGGGSKAKRKARRQRVKLDYDENGQPYDANALPKRQKIRLGNLMDWDERKGLNEFLNPLWRLLRSRCGKPWDKVYSEICANIRLDSAVQRHILEHLHQAVESNAVYGDDGKVYSGDMTYSHRYSELWNDTFFVDSHGILRQYRRKSTGRPVKTPDNVRTLVSCKRYLVCCEGIWYDVYVTRASRLVSLLPQSRHDAALGAIICKNDYFWTGKSIHIKQKKQLSKKDLKRYGLTNN